MAKINYRESSVPQSYKAKVESEFPTFTDYMTEDGEPRTYQVELSISMNPRTHFNAAVDIPCNVIKAVASCMQQEKFKDKQKAALVINKKATGEFIAAALAEYDNEGECYNYGITFDPQDITGLDKEHCINFTDFLDEKRDMDFHAIFVSELLLAHNYSIANRDMVEAFTTTTFDCLHHWLDVNAKTDEVMELELTDYIGRYTEMDETQYLNSLKTVAIASVEVVKDVKKMSITYGEEIKNIAKGNADLNS